MRGANSNRHGGGKPEGKEGDISLPRETYSRFTICFNTKPPSEDGALTQLFAHANSNSLTASFGCRTRKHPLFGEARTIAYVTNRKRGADKVMRQMTPSDDGGSPDHGVSSSIGDLSPVRVGDILLPFRRGDVDVLDMLNIFPERRSCIKVCRQCKLFQTCER